MKQCKRCGHTIVRSSPQARNVVFCSVQCRNKHYAQTMPSRQKEYQRERKNAIEQRDRKKRGKLQCLICGLWYKAPLHHAWQIHGVDEAAYKKHFGLDHKKGLITARLKEIKKAHVFANETVNNLKAGKPFRFVPGDTRAGRYERSAQTLSKLRVLHTLRK